MIDVTPFIIIYLEIIGTLILTHYLTFSFPFAVQIVNKPWSLPKEIILGIMLAPIMLLILILSAAYIEEKHAESMAKNIRKT